MGGKATDFAGIVRRHPVVSYFVIAYAFSWTWVLALALPSGFPGEGEALEKIFGPAFVGMALGPVVACLTLTAFLAGRQGLRELGAGMTRWRLAPKYYAIALGVVPAVALTVLGTFWAVSPDFTPGVFGPGGGLPLLGLGLFAGLAAGLFEEIGWSGFATRNLLGKMSILAIGIVVGVLHGAWHLVAGYWGEGIAYGLLYVPYFLLCWIVGLIGLRVLIVWLYERTGSLLIAQLAHASYTGGLMMLWPGTTSPIQNTLWTGIFAVVLLAVACTIVTCSGRPSERLAALRH